ncbi:NACHT domain-containing protein [Streptomyces sp. NBC_00872]|uniref:NACHT domain-containing protein n=1 Tax=Streptomyces sp. NBC_00872 TaxID=2903686 RepID=UPI003867A2AD|nr:NACHT domain-containing protein [Streptomyces sp. NBC_00872]
MGREYLLLVVLGTVGALALTRHFELGTAATAATLLPTLAPAYLAWKAFQHDRAEAAAVDVEKAADQLARAVKEQWDDEAAIRRLNDPYPLPVAWRAADTDLVEPWPQLAELAHAWPGGPPEDPDRWPTVATGLAGTDAQIGEVFSQRVPTRRLIVLGEPGSGKTMLLIRLMQDLIARRTDGGQVPVLFSLASWDPARQPLEGWLAEQLRRSHPGLRAPAPVAVPGVDQEVDLAQALLKAGRILPLLDGFDELPPALHTLALDALNRALSARQPLVVASRTTAYRAALTRPDAMVRLNGAAGIHLLPLTSDQIAAYLRRDAGGPHTPAADRWNTVVGHLGAGTPVGQALSTPLGLFLARTIYNPRPHTRAPSGPASHPDELCDTAAFPTRGALETQLFNAFIPAAYTPHQPNPPRWSAQRAHHTLVFLARHLEAHRGGSPDLAWWELAYAFPLYIRHFVIGPVFGLTFGLAGGFVFGVSGGIVEGPADGFAFGYMGGLAEGLSGGLAILLTVGLAVGLMVRDAWRNARSARLRWSSDSLAVGLTFGLPAGLAVWLAFGPVEWLAVGFVDGSEIGLVRGVTAGLVWGLASWLVFGLSFALACGIAIWLMRRGARRNPRGPRQRWSYNSLTAWLAVGIVAGLAVGVVVGITDGPPDGFAVGVAGAFMGWLGVGLMSPDVERSTPSTRLRWSSNSLTIGLGAGFTVGLMGWLAYSLAQGVAYGLVGGIMFGLTAGLNSEKPDLPTAVGSVALLTRDRRTFLTIELAGGLVGGLAFGLSDGLVYGLAAGLAIGLVIGLAIGLKRTAWVDFAVARAYLAVRRRVPWRLMTFLQDAHEHRGVLRQVGVVYHFRHIDLQRHLARQPWPPRDPTDSTALTAPDGPAVTPS